MIGYVEVVIIRIRRVCLPGNPVIQPGRSRSCCHHCLCLGCITTTSRVPGYRGRVPRQVGDAGELSSVVLPVHKEIESAGVLVRKFDNHLVGFLVVTLKNYVTQVEEVDLEAAALRSDQGSDDLPSVVTCSVR